MEKLYFPDYEGFLENKEDDEIREFVEDSQCDSIGQRQNHFSDFLARGRALHPNKVAHDMLISTSW